METYYFDVTTFRGEDLRHYWSVSVRAKTLQDAERKIEKRFKNIYDYSIR